MDSNLNNKNMNSIKILATCGILLFGTLLIMSFTNKPTPPNPASIYRITSYDGITLYSYGEYVIVKTDNSVSISK